VTGVSGQVGEPYLLGAVRPEILFPAYMAGFNVAEAFYLATPVLSWEALIVGDPLCAPFGRKMLTRAELEAETDPDTQLPGLFSKRRIAEVARLRFAPERAIVASIGAETLFERGDRQGARAALAEAVRLSPQTADWLMVLATLEDEAGEYDSAIDGYRRVLQLQPKNIVALNNLAYALAVRQNAPAEALSFAKRAVALAPENATLLDTLGWIEHLLGNHTAAIKLLSDAIQRDPKIAEIHLHAAEVFAALGTPERAESELKEALRLDPSLAEKVQGVRARIEKLRPGIR
jgi:tetratricopeptide (TPR) repeat protein